MKYFLTIKELAEYLGVAEITVRTWITQRKIRYYQPGGKLIKFKLSEVDEWIEASKVEADPDLIDKAAKVEYTPARRQPSLKQSQKEVKNGSA